MSNEETKPEDEAATRRFMAAAMIFGFNEQARLATTLGEKVAYRQAREAAAREFRSLGGDTSDIRVDPVILTLPDHRPEVSFYEKDIDLMRATVAEFDARQRKDAPPAEAHSKATLDPALALARSRRCRAGTRGRPPRQRRR